MKRRCVRCTLLSLACLLIALSFGLIQADENGGGENLLAGDFESGRVTYNPWAGVDDAGNLRVWEGWQLAVSDVGAIGNEKLSPSVAVGDLNGDGLPDLVVADARGFFWFYPNSGKLGEPAFTHGEIMPIWLGGNRWDGDVVPRIQLIDYDGGKTLSIVAGNYAGQLYFIPNRGSPAAPDFRMPYDRNVIVVPTHTRGFLWCNYLSPFLFARTDSGVPRYDLLMGDGTYSANSIYVFTNVGDRSRPSFNESQMTKLIPGMGREHLTPQAVDWDNSGKLNIISGERSGFVDLYLNQAPDKTSAPVFDPNPQHVRFGDTEQVGTFTTVCVADLNNDKLFDVLLGAADGHILLSLNTGSLGAPKFGPPVPLKGVNPYPPIIAPNKWEIDRFQPYGSPYEVLECTNANVEKGFVPPPGSKDKGALKFSVLIPQATYFKSYYVPSTENDPYAIRREINYGWIGFQTDTPYRISFWLKTAGNVSGISWHIEGAQNTPDSNVKYPISITGPDCGSSNTWTKVTQSMRINSQDDERNQSAGGRFSISWEGDGTVYLDDFSMNSGN